MGEYEQWDITSGVGITALAVAAARAVETSREQGSVRDPLAKEFVRAAAPPIPMPTDPHAVTGMGERADELWQNMSVQMGVRSRFFDEYFAEATEAGVRQIVLLAAGLDSRTYRLTWPYGCVVFEVDQPGVLEFKDGVLCGVAATARCDRRSVPVDLRDDWQRALLEQGFDPEIPTAWLAEGLFPYLPPEAEDQLLDTVTGYSAPGSRVALEYIVDARSMLDRHEVVEAMLEQGLDLRPLFQVKPDSVPGQRLRERGWSVSEVECQELITRYGRVVRGVLADELRHRGRYLTARLPAPG